MTKRERKMPRKKESPIEGYIETIFDALPKSMNADEVAVLSMVIWLHYIKDMPTVLDGITRSVYTCGNYFGLNNSAISGALIATAKTMMDDDPPVGRMQ